MPRVPVWLRLVASLVAPSVALLVCAGPLLADPWQRRRWRAVDRARAEPAGLRALGVDLPVVPDGADFEGRPIPRVLVSADGISVDYAGWLLALPDDTRADLRRAWRGTGRDLGDLGAPRGAAWPADGLRVTELAEALAPGRELVDLLAGMGGRYYAGEPGALAADLEEILVLADGDLPYRRVVPVLYTAFEAAGTVQLGADLPDRDGVARIAIGAGLPSGCAAPDPPACFPAWVTLRAAPERLEVAVPGDPCRPGLAEECAPGPVRKGACAVVPATDAAIDAVRDELVALGACPPVVLRAEPEVPWRRVVAATRVSPFGVTLGLATPAP